MIAGILKFVFVIAGAVGILLGGFFAFLHITDDTVPEAPRQAVSASFDGDLLAVSDVDQAATAYGDGILDQLPDAVDQLSFISWDGGRPVVASSVPVSNSVISWPKVVDVSPDGRRAYVVETRAAPKKRIDQVADVYAAFPEGKLLTVLDISRPDGISVIDRVEVGVNLASVDIRRDGRMLAIPSTKDGEELVLVTLTNDGRIGKRFAFHVDVPKGEYVRPGMGSAVWHPDGDVLAVTVNNREVRFLKIVYDLAGDPASVDQLGNGIKAGETLSAGLFHPDGRHFLIPDVAWGDNASVSDFLFNRRGTLISIRFDRGGSHGVAGRTEVGRSPEGFALSPDGTRVVTVNMNRTYLPDTIPPRWFPGRNANSLTLLSFDAATGGAAVLDERGFDGLLPENAAFDAGGKNLAVAVFHHRKRDRDRGYVEFWRVDGDKLVRTDREVAAARGVHDLILVPWKEK